MFVHALIREHPLIVTIDMPFQDEIALFMWQIETQQASHLGVLALCTAAN